MIWFISDSHFGHGNIIKYCNRPFMNKYEQNIVDNHKRGDKLYDDLRISQDTIDRHDDALIDNINRIVKPKDTLYHLGDFALRNIGHYRHRIKCEEVHLILGNHDYLKDRDEEGFYSVSDYKEIKYEGRFIVLSHYAMRVWNRSHRGSIMLYGHSHGTLPGIKNSFDVGVDCHGYCPISIKNAIKIAGNN